MTDKPKRNKKINKTINLYFSLRNIESYVL